MSANNVNTLIYILGHRAHHTVFVGIPGGRRHSHRRHKHHHKDGDGKTITEFERPSEFKFIFFQQNMNEKKSQTF